MGEPTRMKSRLEAHLTALGRYNAWEALHPMEMGPAEAISGVGALYELIPRESRSRAFDPSGPIAMHRSLAHMKVGS
jgi:hypothetical protein